MARNKKNTADETTVETTTEEVETAEETAGQEVEETVGNDATENTSEAPAEEVDEEFEKITSTFVSSYDAGKDEDAIKMDMIAAGAKFKSVNRLYTKFLIDFGVIKSKDEVKETLDSLLAEAVIDTEEGFDAASKSVVTALEVTERAANAQIRQWAKKNEKEVFKKAKQPGDAAERNGVTSLIHNWIVDNLGATEDDLYKFIDENGTVNAIRHKTHFRAIFQLAKRVVAKVTNLKAQVETSVETEAAEPENQE